MIPVSRKCPARIPAEALDGPWKGRARASTPVDATGVRIQTRKIEARPSLLRDDPAAQAPVGILSGRRHTGGPRKEFDGLYVITLLIFLIKV
jgi:hypothetical protein